MFPILLGGLLALLVGCGGSTTTKVVTPPPPPPPAPSVPATAAGAQFSHGGFGMTTVAASTAGQLRIRRMSPWNRVLHAIMPTVAADTPATISGSYSGTCFAIAANTPPNSWVPIYQFGQDARADCAMWVQGPGVLTGDPAIGPGTLSTLVVYGIGSNTTAASGQVMIFVNGKPTTLTCTLGTSRRCEDTVDTAPVADNDTVAAGLMPASAAESWSEVTVIVLKQ